MNNAAVVVEVFGDEKAANAGMPLLSRVVDIVLKNGTLNGKVTITLHFDSSKLGKDQQAAAFYYNEKQGKWVGLEGTVDVEKGTVAVTVDHLTMFTAFATPKVVDFKDMQGHWAAEAVEKLAGKKSTVKTAELKFVDNVSIPEWAKTSIEMAVGEGIIQGYPDNTFRAERDNARRSCCNAPPYA